MHLKVHLTNDLDSEFAESLARETNSIVSLTSSEEMPSPADYNILIGGRPDKAELTVSPKLSTLIIPWAGLPETTRLLMLDYPDIAVHNIHHNSAPACEMAISLMLAACKNIIPIDSALRHNDWMSRYRPNNAPLLDGKTALVLGYGAIGRKIAAVCQSLGMKVNAIKRNPGNANDGKAQLYSVNDLHRLLKRSQVLFICLPLTPETKGLIGKQELAMLPQGATLINIARGPIVDEEALYNALCEKRICAGIDVWYEYPIKENWGDTPPSRYPFHELDNVVMTPHLAGHTADTEALRLSALVELLNLAADGKELPNRVNLQLGY